ncbi:MAG: amidohydrolase family protein [Adhaeribacter sp.]
MLLHNLHLADHLSPQSILIREAQIAGIAPAGTRQHKGFTLQFEEAFAFPGLINSHDHLDFNSFPLLGNYHYPNYVEWGKDIHRQNSEAIAQVLQIPKALRIEWGLYKNLLNGITTVLHHGPCLPVQHDLITVFQSCQCLHSVGLEKNWKLKLNHPGRHGFVVIHIGEGTDELAAQEINELIRWNLFRRPLVGVHGVAMQPRQAARFRALVWCPDSNFFLLGKTAAIQELKAHTRVVFGTDSTLSASWNLWDHLRLARDTRMARDQEIMDMLTTNAAWAWQLPHLGSIAPGQQADLVIARKKSKLSLMECFYQLHPEDILLVIHRGEMKLFDASLYKQVAGQLPLETGFSALRLGQAKKYVKGNLPALLKEITRFHPHISLPVEWDC